MNFCKYERYDINKDYHNFITDLQTLKGEEVLDLLKHICMTTPVFGEWNIVKDRILPIDYFDWMDDFTSSRHK